MNNPNITLKKITHKILSFLRVRSAADGLEISDEAIRLAHFDGKDWQTASVRLEPGVMTGGVVGDEEAFIAALRNLKEGMLGPSGPRTKVNVVVALSSASIYSQVFTLPAIKGDDLKKAMELNVQMASPSDVAQMYVSSELLGEGEDSLHVEFSASYIDRSIVDMLARVLLAAGFVVVAIEPRALALLRTLRERGTSVDMKKSYILVDIDGSGAEFVVARKGQLYFEYTGKWSEIADEKGQIPLSRFEESLAGNMRKVLNFYAQHWNDPLAGVILSATAYGDIAERAFKAATDLPIIDFASSLTQSFAPEWLTALGSGIRGITGGGLDKEINLLGEEAASAFREEQLLQFLGFWRIVVAVTFGFLIVVYAASLSFLSGLRRTTESAPSFRVDPGQAQEISSLEASSTAFNKLVAIVKNVESQQKAVYLIVDKIDQKAASSSVALSQVSYKSASDPIALTGSAPTEDDILAFKSAIESDPSFGPVTLPLANIAPQGGVYLFSMTFPQK